MSSERTKRRRIREELDSILYESENLHNQYVESSITSTNNQHEIPSPNSPERYSVRTKSASTIQSSSNSEILPCLNDTVHNYSHDNQLITVHTDICSEVKFKLAKWAVDFNIPQNALNGLLPILKNIPGLEGIPKDARTILKTGTVLRAENLLTVEPGFYHHFGLGLAIKRHFNHTSIDDIDIIKVVIGIDGLPLSKSSSSQLWPILGYIRPFKNTVFPIGIYWGYEKPKDSNEFLKEFVNEVKMIIDCGITFGDTTKKIEIDGFSLDAPAKSFILKIKGHSGFDSCTRCTCEGEYLKNRTCFPYSSNVIKRTHSDYVTRKYEEHHTENSISILSELPIDITCSFSLDYMHLTCLGIMRKMIHLWIDKGPLNVRLPSVASKKLSFLFLSLRSSVPCEFSRKPRGLNEMNRFKATEFRQILIYTGQIVFKNILSEDIYKHFMAFNIGMTILLSSDMENYLEYAKSLLIYFVRNFEPLYGRHLMSFNVHGLTHISDDYQKFGPLDNISAFPFENYLKSLKKLVRKHDKPLQQIINRCNEKNLVEDSKTCEEKVLKKCELKHNHTDGPLLENLNGVQYKKLYLDNIKVKVGINSDSYVLSLHNEIIKIENIIRLNETNEIIIIGKIFETKKPFYEKPIPSTIFNIYEVSNLSSTSKCWSFKCIKNKIMILELYEQKVAFPIIHSASENY